MELKVGDWVVFDLRVGQIKEIREFGQEFSDGWFATSGNLSDRCRPLTLRNKRIMEWFDTMYKRLDEISGHTGFNHPDISKHFATLALKAIDHDTGDDAKPFFDQGSDFIADARSYKPIIQGIQLFRPNVNRNV